MHSWFPLDRLYVLQLGSRTAVIQKAGMPARIAAWDEPAEDEPDVDDQCSGYHDYGGGSGVKHPDGCQLRAADAKADHGFSSVLGPPGGGI
jgi:hypothetical protein